MKAQPTALSRKESPQPAGHGLSERPQGRALAAPASWQRELVVDLAGGGAVNARPGVVQRHAQVAARPAVHRATTVNRGGHIPEPLRQGIAALSGHDLADVTVHRDSPAPAQLQAHAFAQGNAIHLGPGQERHLAHEAWHVVQQRQGRVRETMQMAGSAVNDDARLEAEADRMGALAVASGAVHAGGAGDDSPAQAGISNSARPGQALQRRVKYIGYTGNHVDQIEARLNEYARAQGYQAVEWIGHGLVSIRESPIDYGEIDVSDPQHMALLYHQIAKQNQRHLSSTDRNRLQQESDGRVEKLGTRYRDAIAVRPKTGGERESIESQEAQVELGQKTLRENQRLFPGRVFDIAYIGAGASVAYALQTLPPNTLPADVAVIGPEQPWRHKRGPGVVAHPEHMVTPKRQRPGSGRPIDDVFVDRGNFSDRIDESIAEFGATRFPFPVRKMEQEPGIDNYYRIWMRGARESIYARKVVFAAGSGDHDPGAIVMPGTAIARTPEEVVTTRVMSMDLWGHVADHLHKAIDGTLTMAGHGPAANPAAITVILVGANGGIDIAFDALNKGYQVHWVVGNTGPKFLPGFFNYAAYLPYLRYMRGLPPRQRPVEFQNRDLDRELYQAQRQAQEIYAAQATGHGMFQGVMNRFLPETTRFAGIYNFRGAGATVFGNEVRLPNPNGAPDPIVGDLLVYAQGQDFSTFGLLDRFKDQLVEKPDANLRFGFVPKLPNLAVDPKIPATIGLHTPDDSLEVIGATGHRLAVSTDHSRRPPLVPGGAQIRMSPVVNSLPANVLLNDQLTPIRSQVEASSGFVPRDIGRYANFISDDRTALALHIVLRIPHYPVDAADRLADEIVKSRRDDQLFPFVLPLPPNQRKFQDDWAEWIELVAELYKR